MTVETTITVVGGCVLRRVCVCVMNVCASGYDCVWVCGVVSLVMVRLSSSSDSANCDN